MARTNTYGHYCAAARTLEVVGEKWALLVVRDLLFGPQRFSDLLRSLGGITPKLLTHRLRELETAGVVARDEEAGRREVWYRLTPAGRALRPVIEELLVWGVDHAPPPRPDEAVNPRRLAIGTVAVLNRHGVRPPGPTVWALRLGAEPTSPIHFDGERWTAVRSDEATPDLEVEASPEVWVRLLRARGAERDECLRHVQLAGKPARQAEFARLFDG